MLANKLEMNVKLFSGGKKPVMCFNINQPGFLIKVAFIEFY